MDRLNDATLPFNLKTTIFDSIRGTDYQRARLVIRLRPDYEQEVIFFDRPEFELKKITSTITQLVDAITFKKGKAAESVKIELLGLDENGNQIRGSERDWEYNIQ